MKKLPVILYTTHPLFWLAVLILLGILWRK